MTAWVREAQKHIGLREISGKNDHPLLLSWWISFGAKWLYKQAWCGLFVAHCLRASNRHVVSFWFRARSWESDTMTKLDKPAYGCISVVSRNGGNHVMFVVGIDKYNNLMCLGGNQSNAVTIAPFSQERMKNATYWWPSMLIDGKIVKSSPLPNRYNLPLLQSNGHVSFNES